MIVFDSNDDRSNDHKLYFLFGVASKPLLGKWCLCIVWIEIAYSNLVFMRVFDEIDGV